MRACVWFAVAILASCGKRAPEDDCAEAIAHVEALMEAKLPAGSKPDQNESVKAQMATANTAMTARCREDKWSSEAVTCIKNLKAGDDPLTCEKLLTSDQRDAADKAADTSASSAKIPGQLDASAAIAGIEDYHRKMCACIDYECAEKLQRDTAKLEQSTEHARRDPAIRDKYKKIDDEATQCMATLLKTKK